MANRKISALDPVTTIASNDVVPIVNEGNTKKINVAQLQFFMATACRLATTENIDLAAGGLLEIDEIATVANNRILVWQQTNASENGIYTVSDGSWVRAANFNNVQNMISGVLIPVLEGTAYGGNIFQHTTAEAITVDTTAITFVQASNNLSWGEIQGDINAQSDLTNHINTNITAAVTDLREGVPTEGDTLNKLHEMTGQIVRQDVSPTVSNPSESEDGYVISWDETNNRYDLVQSEGNAVGRYAAVYYVDPVTGNDATAQSNTVSLPYLTINAAADAAYSQSQATGISTLVYIKFGTYEEHSITRNGVDIYAEDRVLVYTSQQGVSILSDQSDSYFGTNNRFNVYGNGTYHNLNARPFNDSDSVNLRRQTICYIEAKGLSSIQIWSGTAEAHAEIVNATIHFMSSAGGGTNKHRIFRNCTIYFPLKIDGFSDANVNNSFLYENCKFMLLQDYTYNVDSRFWQVEDAFNSSTISFIDPAISNNDFLTNYQSGFTSNDELLTNYNPTDYRSTFTNVIEGHLQGNEDKEFKFLNCEFIIERDFCNGIMILQDVVASSQKIIFQNSIILDETPSGDTTAIIIGQRPEVTNPLDIVLAGITSNAATERKSFTGYDDISMDYYSLNNSGLTNLEDNGANVQNSPSGTGAFIWQHVQLSEGNISAQGDIFANNEGESEAIVSLSQTDGFATINMGENWSFNTFQPEGGAPDFSITNNTTDEHVIFINNQNRITISDASNGLGMQYAGDYSDNNTANDRWIPDKAYVDNAVAGIEGGSGDVTTVGTPEAGQLALWTGVGSIEGSAELSIEGGELQSSLAIVANSDSYIGRISLGEHNREPGPGAAINLGNDWSINTHDGDGVNIFSITVYNPFEDIESYILLLRYDYFGVRLGNQVVINADTNGMTYNRDHSGGNINNDRWIPDKAYVDNAVAGIEGGSGDVTTVGTPEAGQLALWTGVGSIEGNAGLAVTQEEDGISLSVSGDVTANNEGESEAIVSLSQTDGFATINMGENWSFNTFQPEGGAPDFSITNNTTGEHVIFINNQNQITISDASNSLGMQYAGDYSDNNVANDRWIPDKAYVDNAVANAGNSLTNIEDNGTNVQNSPAGTGNFQWGNVQINGEGISAPGDITANDFIATSDIRLKTNILPISNYKDIYHLNAYKHGWEHDDNTTFGLLAQEVEQYFPELVKTDANGYKAIRYIKLIPLMLEAIKDLKQKLNILQS